MLRMKRNSKLLPEMVSLYRSPDACRHNYPLQRTVVWSKVRRVNTDCGLLTVTNDIPRSSVPLLCFQLGS